MVSRSPARRAVTGLALLCLPAPHGALGMAPSTRVADITPTSAWKPPPTLIATPIDTTTLSASEVRREDGDSLEGVHADPSHPLTQRVLSKVPELSDYGRWYKHPKFLGNGHAWYCGLS